MVLAINSARRPSYAKAPPIANNNTAAPRNHTQRLETAKRSLEKWSERIR
jgi:hypothetical protein